MPQPSESRQTSTHVQVRGLSHRYADQQVLTDLDFDLPTGQITVFLGRNGAGKSTALAVLAGILCPDQGEVSIDGRNPWNDPACRRAIGYLPEHPPLYPQLDVSEHLQFAARLHGLPADRVDPAVEQAIERFELGTVRRRLAGRLSKGFQQRLGLALALVHQPNLVLLDEPGNGLDPVQLSRLRELIQEQRDRVTVLFSTHMLNEALSVADQLLVLCDGRLTHTGPAGDLDHQAGTEARLLALMCGQDVPK
jgi:ABC-2 type transport system ATP-binding protein